MPSAAARPKANSLPCAFWRSANSPSTSAWYSWGNRTSWSLSFTSETTEPRSRPRTFMPTSIRRELSSREMRLGVGRTLTSATCDIFTWPPPGVSSGRSRMLCTSCRASGNAPGDDVVHLVVDVQVADLVAGDDRGRCPADVARLQAVLRGLVEVGLDADVRHVHLELGAQVDDALDPLHRRMHLVGLVAQRLEVRAEDPNGDRLARAGEHLVDALVQVGRLLAEEARGRRRRCPGSA